MIVPPQREQRTEGQALVVEPGKASIHEIVARTRRLGGQIGVQSTYYSRNPLLSSIFWRRVRLLGSFLEVIPTRRKALDFGIGWGVMLPLLAYNFKHVDAIDIEENQPFTDIGAELLRRMGLENVSFAVIPHGDSLKAQERGAYDCVVAADVLEHVENPSLIIDGIRDLLSPGGVVLASIPTENLLYRTARMAMLRPAHTEGHVQEPAEIELELRSKFETLRRVNLYGFFHLYCFRVKTSSR